MPPTSFGYRRRSAKTRAGGHPLRAVAQHEVAARAQARARGQGRPEPSPRGVHRQRGLVADQGAGLQPGRHGGGGRVHGRESGWPAASVISGTTTTTTSLCATAAVVSVVAVSMPGRDHLAEPLRQAGLARERHAAAERRVVPPRGLTVGAVNPVPLAGYLHGERQADLAEPDHRDLRPVSFDRTPAGCRRARWPADPEGLARRCPAATAAQSLEAARIASATSTRVDPCRMVTMSAGFAEHGVAEVLELRDQRLALGDRRSGSRRLRTRRGTRGSGRLLRS